FRTFTRRHDIQLKHQLEFLQLLGEATERYKQAYGAYVINRTNKDQIYDKLRKKLGLDFLTNTEFGVLDVYEITNLLLYIVGFARIQNTLKFEEVKKTVEKLQEKVKRKLPEDWKEILAAIRRGLPTLLLIKDRRLAGTDR